MSIAHRPSCPMPRFAPPTGCLGAIVAALGAAVLILTAVMVPSELSAQPQPVPLAAPISTSCEFAPSSLRVLCPLVAGQVDLDSSSPFAVQGLSRVISAYASVLASGDSTSSVVTILTYAAMDKAIVAALPQKAFDYCAKLQTELGEAQPQPDAATACLRPVCLLPAPKGGYPETCKTLQGDLTRYRDAAKRAATDVKLPACSQEHPTCLQVDEAAQRMVALADELRGFVIAAAKNKGLQPCVTPKVEACRGALINLVSHSTRTWVLGAALTQAFAEDQSLAAQLDKSDEFRSAWKRVLAASDQSAKDGTFPWDYRLTEALAQAQPPLEKSIDPLESLLETGHAKNLAELWSRGETAAQLIGHAPPSVAADAELVAFSTQWQSKIERPLGSRPLPSDILKVAAALESLRGSVDSAQKKLAVLAGQLVFGSITTQGAHCQPGKSNVDWQNGSVDLCFPTQNVTRALVGLRLAFTPCKPYSADCDTVGNLQLLIDVNPPKGTTVVAFPLGIDDIQAEVTTDGKVQILSVPPVTSYHFDKTAFRGTAQKFLPPVLTVTDEGSIELKSGPVLKLHGIAARIAGLDLPLPLPDIVIDSSGVTVGHDRLDTALHNLLAAKIAALPRVNLLGISISPIRLMDAGTQCGTIRYTLVADELALCGQTTVPLALGGNNTPLPLPLLAVINAAGHISLRPAFDPNAALQTVNGLLSSLPVHGVTAEALTLDGSTLKIATQWAGPPACPGEISLPLTSQPVDLSAAVTGAFKLINPAKCVASIVQSLVPFSLFGLSFNPFQDGRVCVSANVCIVGVTLNAGQPDFTHARLDDGGRLAGALKAEFASTLGSIIPVNVSSVEIAQGKLTTTLTLSIPGMPDPVPLVLRAGLGEPVNINVKDVLYQTLCSKLNGQKAQIGSLEFVVSSPSCTAKAVSATATVTIGEVPVTLHVQLLPSLDVKPEPPNAQAILAVAMRVLHDVTGDDGIPDITIGPDYIPVVRIPLSVSIPIAGIDSIRVAAVAEATLKKPLRFAGPVTVSIPLWITVFAGVDLGDITGQVDLDHPTDFAIGATLAITSGAASSNVVKFTGRLSILTSQDTVQLNGSLDFVQASILQATGSWYPRRGLIEINAGATGMLASLPIPREQVTIDAAQCFAAGTSDVSLVGISLAHVDAGLFLAHAICSPPSAGQSDVKAKFSDCSNPDSQLGAVCLKGSAGFGNIIQVQGQYVSPIPIPVPKITGHFGIPIASIDADASVARARLTASLLGLHVHLSFPTLAGVTADDIAKMLGNLLHLSIDINALLRGEINISPDSGDGGDDDGGGKGTGSNGTQAATSTPSPGSNNANNPSQPPAAPQANPPAPAPAPAPVQGPAAPAGSGTRPGQIGFAGGGQTPLRAVLVPNTANVYRLVTGEGEATEPYVPDILLRQADADRLMQHQFFMLQGQPIGKLVNGRPFLLVCQPQTCAADHLFAISVLSSVDDKTPGGDPQSLGKFGRDLIPAIKDGELENNWLANALAADFLQYPNDPSPAYCLSAADSCYAALLSNRDSTWSLLRPDGTVKIDPQSLMGRILTPGCTSGCTTDVTATLGGLLDYDVVTVAPPSALPKIALLVRKPNLWGGIFGIGISFSPFKPWEPTDTRYEHVRFDATFRRQDEHKVSFATGAPNGIHPWEAPHVDAKGAPTDTLWPAFLTQLDAEQVPNGDTWFIANHQDGAAEYIAATTSAVASTRPMLSAYRKLSGKSYVRCAKYPDLLRKLTTTWAEGAAGEYGDGINHTLAHQLQADTAGKKMIGILAEPKTSDAGFRLNPLLLFAPPDMDACP